jgi:Cdc6-like AAA superfamily ATPase
MSDGLGVVPLKNHLFSDFREDQIKKIINARLQELNMTNPKYKLDAEFLTFLTNLIEYLVQKKDNVDKKRIAIEIMRDIFGATEEEQELLKRNIDYLHSNKVIKKVSYYKLFKTAIWEWMTKK